MGLGSNSRRRMACTRSLGKLGGFLKTCMRVILGSSEKGFQQRIVSQFFKGRVVAAL